jgi:pilus assembly protein Flp/PilA
MCANTDYAISSPNFSHWPAFCPYRIGYNSIQIREVALELLFRRFWADQSAATSIEYALIAGGLSIVILAAVNGLGITLTGKYLAVSTALK